MISKTLLGKTLCMWMAGIGLLQQKMHKNQYSYYLLHQLMMENMYILAEC